MFVNKYGWLKVFSIFKRFEYFLCLPFWENRQMPTSINRHVIVLRKSRQTNAAASWMQASTLPFPLYSCLHPEDYHPTMTDHLCVSECLCMTRTGRKNTVWSVGVSRLVYCWFYYLDNFLSSLQNLMSVLKMTVII